MVIYTGFIGSKTATGDMTFKLLTYPSRKKILTALKEKYNLERAVVLNIMELNETDFNSYIEE